MKLAVVLLSLILAADGFGADSASAQTIRRVDVVIPAKVDDKSKEIIIGRLIALGSERFVFHVQGFFHVISNSVPTAVSLQLRPVTPSIEMAGRFFASPSSP